jgi:DNA-binding beta-propeller fold protein YncE
MHRKSVWAKVLLVPSVLLATTVPALIASAHSSGGLPIGPLPRLETRAAGAGNNAAFVNFETPHVHPLDISPDGNWLAACNTPDGRIEIYAINPSTGELTFSSSVTVGVDPVSVRFRTNDELWAVNAISDSISIIDRTIAQVTDTIITYRLTDTGTKLEGLPNGDEPMDVVFIDVGGTRTRAVVSCTRTDILQLYNTSTLVLLDESLRLDGEEPRELATDGTAVWAGIFESGNGTTSITGIIGASAGFPPRTALESVSNPYGGAPTGIRGLGEFFHDAAPASGAGWNVAGVAVLPAITPLSPAVPQTDLIVRNNGAGAWLDDNGRDWAAFIVGASAAQSGRSVGWTLLDNDVARVVESGGTLSEDGSFGTSGYVTRQMNIVMAIARNPVGGAIFSVGTDATNQIRFEPNITGTFTRVMLSAVNGTTGAQLFLKDLNVDHLAAAQFAQNGVANAYFDGSVPQSERDKSIGDPRGIAFNLSGSHAYISGMGSNNIVCVVASTGDRVSTGHTFTVPAGPTGLAHHGSLNRLYVLSKFASQITVINTATPGSEATVQTVDIFDPTPSAIKNGRPHLYDTHANSGLGQIACASCHVDARFDRLGWNLGNPNGGTPLGTEKPVHGIGDLLITGSSGSNPLDTHNTLFVQTSPFVISSESAFGNFSSVKGVMTTQTFQDIIGKEPFHWRGDRDGIEEFAGAFLGLQGGAIPDGTAMQQFEDFLASVWFEPNPMRPLDNALPGGPPLSTAYTGDHDNLALPGHFSPGTSTGKSGFSALGTQLPAGDAFAGFNRYVDTSPDSIFSCVVCHTLPIGSGSTSLLVITAAIDPPTFSATAIPPSTNGSAHLGMVELDGTGQRQIKVAGLRNQSEKEGLYLNYPGVPSRAGFGVLHDGIIDGTARFLAEPAFDTSTDQDLANLVAFTLCVRGDDIVRLQGLGGAPTGGIPPAAIDHTAHAAVGAQAVGSDPVAAVLIDVAADDEIDLVVETRIAGQRRRYTQYNVGGDYLSDRASDGLVTQLELAAAPDPGFDLTYTGLQESTGKRIGIDRDEDGGFDRDEADLGSDITNSNDNAFIGTTIPAVIGALNTFTSVAAAHTAVTPTAGMKGVFHIEGGDYSGAVTLTKPLVLRKLVDPISGSTVGGVVRIGTP